MDGEIRMNNADKPASPLHPQLWGGEQGALAGLTKREYFAGLAMQGILAGNWEHESPLQEICSEAVIHADQLIVELEKSK